MNPLDTRPAKHPGEIPSSPVVWPEPRHVQNQVQQTKSQAKGQAAFVLPSVQPSTSAVPARTTPKNVSHVRVVTKPSVNGQKQITLQFNHPGGDPYFNGVNVYLKQAGKQPTLVAGGAKSPVTFTVPTHNAPHTITITSVGNWGETTIVSSPSARVNLK